MCHVHNEVGGYLSGISTLDTDDGLSVLSVIHCKSENEENYSTFFEFFKSNLKDVTTRSTFVVSCDGYKSLIPAVVSCFPNAIHVKCTICLKTFQLLKQMQQEFS